MSKKDYILIARVLKDARETAVANGASASAFHALDYVARRMAQYLAAANPRFDEDRFLRAAGAR